MYYTLKQRAAHIEDDVNDAICFLACDYGYYEDDFLNEIEAEHFLDEVAQWVKIYRKHRYFDLICGAYEDAGFCPERAEALAESEHVYIARCVNNGSTDNDVLSGIKNRITALRMAENKTIGMVNGLTEEQCDALEELCQVRHEIRTTKMKYFFSGEEDKYITSKFFEVSDIEKKIKELFGVYPWKRRDYLDTIDWDYLMEDYEKEYYEYCGMEEPDCFFDGYDLFYSDAVDSINHAKKQVNLDIEAFLTKIDQKYKTNYASTGTQRI